MILKKKLIGFNCNTPNFENQLQLKSKQSICTLPLMNKEIESMFDIKFDKTLFDHIKKQGKQQRKEEKRKNIKLYQTASNIKIKLNIFQNISPVKHLYWGFFVKIERS